ncbi:MAG: hypothetical protein IJQ90_04085 [Alphaproteobacteria bacterium]|nr:hypothetical protein [Alphaproteobacteria bacterium]
MLGFNEQYAPGAVVAPGQTQKVNNMERKIDRLVKTIGKTIIVELLGVKTSDCENELFKRKYIQKGRVRPYTSNSIDLKVNGLIRLRRMGVIRDVLVNILESKWLDDNIRYQAKLYIMWIDSKR